MGRLLAVSDLHVGHRGNRPVTDGLRPGADDDWLIVAGDVAERTDEVAETLELLAGRFAKVIWTPGNHELWTTAKDPVQLHGVDLYERLVRDCREIGVVTPEDPYPVWEGDGGPATVVPMFLLYDYSWLPTGAADKTAGLAEGRARGVVATDEFLLSPQPYATREAWCAARVRETRRRLDALDPGLPTVLVNHFPLVREPTHVLMHPEFAMWCGTDETADWHRRYRAVCAVYGHLHIPRTTYYDGVRFEEVSVGYPREWRRRGLQEPVLRQILPEPRYGPGDLNKWGGHFPVSARQEAEFERLKARLRG
ncbi:metallophosphoesterase family protein [Tomitella gaofuii]|uniref:metallophosphoesterase family protein n=1 Tax=Tomitella gaofuii TaxID=2760083 RepID=UPI0015FE0634|nr:metallophosphoesterase [Tomitella gaofuii]